MTASNPPHTMLPSANWALNILDKDNANYCTAVLVITPTCGHCHKTLGDECAIALGAPYHCLLHEYCAPLFNYENRRWVHQKPLSAYRHQ